MSDFQPKFQTLVDIYKHATASFADRPLFGVKTRGQWVWMTYGEFGKKVNALRGALSDLGVTPGDRVAVISNNRPEWAVAGYATYGLGGAFVPMYENMLPKDWKYILKDCGAKILFVANEGIRDKIVGIWDDLPALEHVVLLEGAAEGDKQSTFESHLDHAPGDYADVKGEDVAGYIYTSGTTGNPKGVLLSHQNLAYNVSAIHELVPIGAEDRSLSFLPWAHSFGQTAELHGLVSMGASLGIAEAVDKIVANLAEVRPTVLFAVPRIFNRIYDGLHKRMNEEGGLKLKLFNAAVSTAETRKKLKERRQRSGWVDFKHNALDKLVFSKVRERFGGRLKYAVSGGAALSRDVAEFVDNLGIMVYEGYGLTETSPIAATNCPAARKIGSVGRPIPGVDIEIDTVVTGDPKHGEIVIYGHNVMMGYYGLEEENKKVLVEKDGKRGFRSGDMGYLDGDGFLYITGRIKEQYKLLNGKYVVPTPLEEKLCLSPYITNVMIHGQNQNFNVALVIPDFESVKGWAAEKGITGGPEELVKNDAVRKLIEEQLEQYSGEFKQYEKVRKFTLATEEFTVDNGMLTPKMSVKRRIVLKHYEEQINSLFK